MKKTLIITVAIALVVLGMIFLWVQGTYNGLVSSQEDVNRAWADVQSTYQRRADLIPNLVETVKGYAAHEREVLTGVADARSRVGQMVVSAENLTPEALRNFQAAQQQLSGALTRLLAVAEQYPDLKANQNFLDLQTQLEGTENRINVARSRFNESAQGYNTRRRRFPAIVIANLLGFGLKPYFEAEAGAERAPKVSFQ